MSYNLIISITEGWEDIENYEFNRIGLLNYYITNIGSQPALNINGTGNITLIFQMDTKEAIAFTFEDNWYQNATTKIFINRSVNIPINVNMICVHSRDIYITSYRIMENLDKDGWQYVYLSKEEI